MNSLRAANPERCSGLGLKLNLGECSILCQHLRKMILEIYIWKIDSYW